MKIIRKYRIPFFVFFTLILTWCGGFIYFNDKLNDIFSQKLLIILKIIFIPSIIAPFFIACVIQYLDNKKKGIVELLKRFLPQNTKYIWYVIAIITPVLVHLVASIIDSFRGITFLTPFGNSDYNTIFVALQVFLLAGFAEEMGWRGYLQHELQLKYNSLFISIIIGIIVAIWHFPLFFSQNDIHSNASFISFFFLMIAVAFIYTWLMDNTHSVLIIALFHTSHDIASANFSLAGYFSTTLIYSLIVIIIISRYGIDKFSKLE